MKDLNNKLRARDEGELINKDKLLIEGEDKEVLRGEENIIKLSLERRVL